MSYASKAIADLEKSLITCANASRSARRRSLQAAIRIHKALDRLIQLYTETNKPAEVKKWAAEKSKLATSSPPAKVETAKP